MKPCSLTKATYARTRLRQSSELIYVLVTMNARRVHRAGACTYCKAFARRRRSVTAPDTLQFEEGQPECHHCLYFMRVAGLGGA